MILPAVIVAALWLVATLYVAALMRHAPLRPDLDPEHRRPPEREL